MKELINIFFEQIGDYGWAHFITQIIAFLALIVAIWSSLLTQKKYIETKQPYLCFILEDYDGLSVLSVKNTGGLPAKNIIIDFDAIGKNGIIDIDFLEIMFQNKFDLYPQEEIRGMIANTYAYGEFIRDDAYITISISYNIGKSKKKTKYSRTVPFSKNFDVEYRNRQLRYTKLSSEKMKEIGDSSKRIANYLDGKRSFTDEDESNPNYRILRKDLHVALERVFGDKKLSQ